MQLRRCGIARGLRRIATADRRIGRDPAKPGLPTLPALAPQSPVSTRSGAMMKVRRVAPWLALALLVLMGGELVLAYLERLLGIHGLADVTPQALVAIVAARDAAQLCLALFGVYAILQAPLTSIGLRLPKVGWLALGAAIGLGTALIFPRLVQELRLLGSQRAGERERREAHGRAVWIRVVCGSTSPDPSSQ